MKTLGRNADNDLYLEAGNLAILHDADAQCAIIESILQTQQGELQFEPDKGIDYFGTVLQNPTYIDFWAAQVQSRIAELDFVESVDDFTYRFEKETSTLYWSMSITNTDDDRLDIRDKKTIIDGSPGIDVSWNDIYDKPTGVQQALDMVEAMHEEAIDTREKLDGSSTLRDAKGLLNKIIFEPNDEEYARTRQISFSFSGVPLGTIIDVSNIRLDILNTGTTSEYYAPFIVEINDGLKLRSDQTITMYAIGNEIKFIDEDKGKDSQGNYYTTQKHTLMKGGDVTIKIKGNITKIWSADPSKPIFLHTKNRDGITFTEPFPYLSGINVGARVPLSGIGDGSFKGFENLKTITWDVGAEEDVSFGAYSFSGCSSLMDITWIPQITTNIGEGCFSNCKSLKSLKGLENTAITQIPDKLFYGCTALNSCQYLPSSIIALGNQVFFGCTSINDLGNIPQSIESFGEECFCGCTGITSLLYPPELLQSIGVRCFADCTSLTSVYIPENTNTIAAGAFDGCTNLTNIMSDASSVPSVDSSAFNGESPIVYVPASLLDAYTDSESPWKPATQIKKYGVYEFSLTDIAAGTTLLSSTSNLVSDSIWTITYGIEDNQQRFMPSTSYLPSFTYTNEVSAATITIKGYIRRFSAASSESYPFLATTAAYQFANLKSVTIKDSPLEMIGDYAFAQCNNLSIIDCGFEESRDYCLGEYAFWGCTSLQNTGWLKAGLGRLVKEIETTYEELPDGTNVPVETAILFPAFGARCFWQSGITELSYNPTDVNELPAYCFSETQLSSINGIGTSTLKSLGEYCFSNCDHLTDITALAVTGIKTLPNYCFAECGSLESLEGIENLSSDGMGSNVFENCAINTISHLVNTEGITSLSPYMFAGCKLESLQGLTERITSLGEGCFSQNRNLVDISALIDSPLVTTIPNLCFQETGITSLIGCWNISSIGEYAFANCTGLISTSGLGPDIATIGDYAFRNCTGLKQVSCIASSLPTVFSTAFIGVSTGSIPLYVREEMVNLFSRAQIWGNFASVTSRTIKISFQNIGGQEATDFNITHLEAKNSGVKVSINPDEHTGVGIWYVDYGDGSGIEHHYGNENISINDAMQGHYYSQRGNYTITLFGDITEIWGAHTDVIVNDGYEHKYPEELTFSPFLGKFSDKASSVVINSDYLKKIGDFCFFHYGQRKIEGNINKLSVSIQMNTAGEVGSYAFARQNDIYSSLGTLSSFNAKEVGDFTFYRCGIDSSSPFQTVTTTHRASFGLNPLITNLSGFSRLTKVTEELFSGCTGIVTTSGLSSVTGIDQFGFIGCTGITTVRDFNDNFSYIENGAFKGCPKISKIFMANIVPPSLVENGFDETVFNSAIVYVPAGYEDTYKSTHYWTKFKTEKPSGDIEWRITSRSISFLLKGVLAGQQTKNGNCIVNATGRWVISYGDGEESRQYQSGSTELESYTFTTSGDKIVRISGPITSIGCSEVYPIFSPAGASGTNTWLDSVESSDAMDISEFGNYLFSGCTNLKSVKSVPSVVSIGDNVFSGATNLTDISGLSSVASVGQSAFYGCTSLQSLYGLDSVTALGSNSFEGCTALKYIDGLGTGIKTIGENAFKGCTNLQEVQVFSEEPPSVFDNSFSGVPDTVPLYVRTKCISAYKGDNTWSSIFSDIRSRFVEFNLTGCPANLTVEGDLGIVNSDSFWTVEWDSYDADSFVQTKEDSQYLPAHTYKVSGNHTIRLEGAIKGIYGSIEEIQTNENQEPTDIIGKPFLSLLVAGSNSELQGDSHLLTRTFRSEYSTLETVGEAAFLKNGNLSDVYLSGIKTIGKAGFAYDSQITNIALLDTVGTLEDYAFYGCSGITNIVGLNGNIGDDGQLGFEIGNYAFGGTPYLSYIQVGVPDPSKAIITSTSFGNLKADPSTGKYSVTVYVQKDSVPAYEQNTEWRKFIIASQVLTFTLKNVPSGTTIQGISDTNATGCARIESSSRWTISWDDGSMNTMESNQTSFPSHTYVYDENATEEEKAKWDGPINGNYYRRNIDISITGTITRIACQSAANIPFLTTEIGMGNPYLVSIRAPESMGTLEQLGDFVFQGCSALESVSGFNHVKSIGSYAFNGCTALANLGDSTSGFLSCTSIGNKAFSGCQNLQTLAAFPSVLSIGIRAFENCISLNGTTGLGKAYEDKTIAQWESEELLASFGAYAFEGCGFGALDMFSYAKPPTIQSSTFPGNPSDVLVFVSPLEGALDAYRKAPVWSRYSYNIIATSSISFTIGEGNIPAPSTDSMPVYVDTMSIPPKIHYENPSDTYEYVGEKVTTSGMAVVGENGKLDFIGQYVLIDWGDGTTTTKLNTSDSAENTSTWQFPNHVYSSGVTGGPVTITIRGDISRIYTNDADDISIENPDTTLPNETMKPFLALAPYTITETPTSEESSTVTEIDKSKITYNFALDIKVGSNSKLSRIGSYCFYKNQIRSCSFGKPTNEEGEGIEIGDCAFFNCNSSCLNISAEVGGIKSVGAYSFALCKALPDIDFLDGVQTIGVKSFYGCQGLKHIKIPATARSICKSAFEGCYGIGGANDNNGIVWEQSADRDIIDNKDINIGDRAFYGCIGANNESWPISIPSQVHKIGKSAFCGCGMSTFEWGTTDSELSGTGYTLFSQELSTSDTGIFENCSNLSSLIIHHRIDTIPDRAFCRCNRLETISEDIEPSTIKPYAFYGCGSLTNESMANLLSNVIGEIGNYAFARCSGLTAITIPYSVTSLGEGCFNRSTEDFLTGRYAYSIDYSDSSSDSDSEIIPIFRGIQYFESWMTNSYGNKRTDVWGIYDSICKNDNPENSSAFNIRWGREENGEWEAPQGAIGDGCFMNCNGLNIDWGRFPSITKVPDYCFYNCTSLFYGEPDLSMLPDTITSFGRFSLARTGMFGIGRNRDHSISASLSPALFLGCKNLSSLGDSEYGLTNLFSLTPSDIPDGCFYDCSSLDDIDGIYYCGVREIGKYSFAKTAIKSDGDHNITNALATVTKINDGCFMECMDIKGIFYGLPLVTYYPYKCFYGCSQISKIAYLYVPQYDSTADDSANVAIMLEGESFGADPNITDINLPYSQMVTIVNADGSKDPFSGIENKSSAVIIVPNEIVSEYNDSSYWGGDESHEGFTIVTSFDGMTPSVTILMSVPSEGGTIKGSGKISIDTSVSTDLAISWGDGTGYNYKHDVINGVLDLSAVDHTYSFGLPSGWPNKTVELSIYGAIVSIEGNADNKTSSIISNKTVVPFLYTKVRNYQTGSTVPRIAENSWFSNVLFHEENTSLMTIGDGCFGYCTNMTPPNIPISVTTLGKNAFFGCDGLTSLDIIPVGSLISNIGQYCFAYCENLTNYSGFTRLTSLVSVPNGCFAKATSVVPQEETKLDWLPSSITSIGFAAFQHVCFSYFNLQNSSPITVGNYAFRYNTALKNFTTGSDPDTPGIKLNLTGTNVFRDCTGLTSLKGLTLASTNTYIPEGTFRGCNSLTTFAGALKDTNVITIRDAAFYGTGFSNLASLPHQISSIGNQPATIYNKDFTDNSGGAFEGCENLTSLTGFPSSITFLGTAAFKGCALGDLTGMTNKVSSFGTYCFAESRIEDLDGLSTNISILPKGCFSGCSGLTSITLPSSISEIGANCFVNSINLATITVNGTSEVITLDDNPAMSTDDNIFPYDTLNNNSSFSISVPADLINGYKSHWGSSGRFDTSKFVATS